MPTQLLQHPVDGCRIHIGAPQPLPELIFTSGPPGQKAERRVESGCGLRNAAGKLSHGSFVAIAAFLNAVCLHELPVQRPNF